MTAGNGDDDGKPPFRARGPVDPEIHDDLPIDDGDDEEEGEPAGPAAPLPNGKGQHRLEEPERKFISLAEARRREAIKQGPYAANLAEWLGYKIPPPEYLIGEVFEVASRCEIYGDTGIGKTLFALMLAGAIAAGDQFLNWPGTGKRRRVLYIDGEMSRQSVQRRLQLVAAQYGEDLDLRIFNRQDSERNSGTDPSSNPAVLGGWPALNKPPGMQWLRQVVEAYRPDLIVFDSVMSLIEGIMTEEESWSPMRPVVRWLTGQNIAQVWLHHSNAAGLAYGSKTRQWEMDCVLALRRPKASDDPLDQPDPNAPPDDDTVIELEFTKSRNRTKENAEQFHTKTARFVVADERAAWVVDDKLSKEAEIRPKGRGRKPSGTSGAAELLPLMITAYGALCVDHQTRRTVAEDGAMQYRVKVDVLRAWLMTHGKLDHDNGKLTATARTWFYRAKLAMTDPVKGQFLEEAGEIWRITSKVIPFPTRDDEPPL